MGADICVTTPPQWHRS